MDFLFVPGIPGVLWLASLAKPGARWLSTTSLVLGVLFGIGAVLASVVREFLPSLYLFQATAAFVTVAGLRWSYLLRPAAACAVVGALIAAAWWSVSGGDVKIVVGESRDPTQIFRQVAEIDGTFRFIAAILTGVLATAVWWRARNQSKRGATSN